MNVCPYSVLGLHESSFMFVCMYAYTYVGKQGYIHVVCM